VVKVKNLGKISSNVLVFGGSYSNLQSLIKLKEISQSNHPNNIICTGDTIAYCAQPEECVSEIRKWDINVISGNVEKQISNDADDCGCNFKNGTKCDDLSLKWYPYCKEKLSSDSVRWMKSLPDFISFEINGKNFLVVHGSFSNISEFKFKSTPWKMKEKEFLQTKVDVIIAGHCGIPFSDAKNGKIWINAGVIGMPANEGRPDVWYLTITPHEDSIEIQHNSYAYDYESTITLMEKNNLPKEYSETLRSGLWDNMDILPQKERDMKNKKLDFSPIILR